MKVSGPVGNGVGLPPALTEHVAAQLGLSNPPVTTQVVFRDAIAAWVADLAVLGAVCESVATDIRLGQHDGVHELEEPRGRAQEGSSAMPHKRNPVAAENITGLAKLLRGYVGPVLESVALWQHRDISHSSVERVVLPDAAAVAQTVLKRTTRMVTGLQVSAAQVLANIERAGAELASSRLLVRLLADGVRRPEAAARVRELIADDAVAATDLDAAAAEVLASDELDRVFDGVRALRDRHTPQPRQ